MITSIIRRQPRLPSLFLIVVVAACLVASIWIAWQLHAKPYDDLPTFFWATRLAFDQGLSAYQPVHFQELGQLLDRKIYPFLYPPPSVLLFSPMLVCVDYEQCKLFFSCLNVLLWWVLAWVLYYFYVRCALSNKPFVAGMAVAFFALAYMPLLDTLKNGQVNIIVLLCLMPALFAPAGRWQQSLSGLLLACAIILKIYVLLLLPVMLVFGRWREVITSLVSLVLLAATSVVLLPISLWHDWFVLGSNTGYGKGIPQLLTIPFNQSFNGFFIRLFLERRGLGQTMEWTLWIYATALVCMGAVIYVIFKYLRCWQQGCSAALALTLLLINLVAPLTWRHHYVFALPAIVWVVALMPQQPCKTSRVFVAALFMAALGFLAVPYLGSHMLPPPGMGKDAGIVHNLLLSMPLLAALVIFVIFIYLIVRQSALRPCLDPWPPG